MTQFICNDIGQTLHNLH